jgi:hypothetical protein
MVGSSVHKTTRQPLRVIGRLAWPMLSALCLVRTLTHSSIDNSSCCRLAPGSGICMHACMHMQCRHRPQYSSQPLLGVCQITALQSHTLQMLTRTVPLHAGSLVCIDSQLSAHGTVRTACAVDTAQQSGSLSGSLRGTTSACTGASTLASCCT